MPALSTAWNIKRLPMAQALDEIEGLGFSRVELSRGIREEMLPEIRRRVVSGRVRITSVHCFCPKPPPGTCLLTALDPGEREEAVRRTKVTIDIAAELGALAVVVHLGAITALDPAWRERLRDAYLELGPGDARYQELVGVFRKERAAGLRPHLTPSLASLGEVCAHAAAKGVTVALETRVYPDELPGLDEFALYFEEFPDAPLGYWHDIGHAYYESKLLGHDAGEYLRRYGAKLAGCHLHDIIGLDDHRAPGQGEIDYTELLPYLGKRVLRVLEVTQADAAALRKGVELLRRLGVA